MSSVKVVDKKKSVAKARSDSPAIRISEPFNFVHAFHIAQEEFETRSVDEGGSLPLTPPPPCPGSKDGSVDEDSIREQIPNETLSQILKDEIGNIVEEKLQKVIESFLPDIKERNRHCPGCACSHSDQKKNEYLNTSSRHQTEPVDTYTTATNQSSTSTQRQDSVTSNDSELDQTNSRKPVSNPIYPISGGEPLYIPLSGTLVKYGSEIHLMPSQTHVHNQPDTLNRSNTMPLKQGLHQSPLNRLQFSGRRGNSRDKPDDRECLAKALQANIVELTNDVIFKDSELPDSLLTDGCLTENESTRCRKYRDPRDEVRLLLSIIKGRDLDILKRFLKHIKSHNANVALKIEEQFEQNKKLGVRSNLCALCKLTSRVDLKYIADALYKHFLLDDGLYNIIFQTELPTGAQGEIWHKVFACLNQACTENASLVRKVLIEALVHKDHYHQIAKEIQWMLGNQNEISCRCAVKVRIPPGDSIVSIMSSRSPPTSISDVFEQTNDDNLHSVDETDGEATTPVQKDPRPHKENILSTDSANSVRLISVEMIEETVGLKQDTSTRISLNGTVKDKVNAINAQSTQTEDIPSRKPHVAPRKLALHSDNLISSNV